MECWEDFKKNRINIRKKKDIYAKEDTDIAKSLNSPKIEKENIVLIFDEACHQEKNKHITNGNEIVLTLG